MSVETGVIAMVLKWWMAAVVPAVVGVIGYIWKRVNNTYSKEETVQQIELRTIPLKDVIERNTKATDRLTEVFINTSRIIPKSSND